MNRRGYVFTVAALVIILVVLAGIRLQSDQQDIRDSGLQSHILATNAFLLQLEEDIPRATGITAYRSLLGLEEHVSATGEYLPDLDAAFIEVITNGTVNGTPYDIMDDATLDVFEERMEQIAGSLGVDLDLAVSDVSLQHIDPWHLQVNVTVRINATTRDERTRWSYTTPTSSVFSIQELKDPLYTVGTLGRVPSTLTPSNVSRPYILANNDTFRLRTLWNETMYVNDTAAPSFLMRFEGNLSSSPHGITSLVDTKLLDAQDLSVKTDHSVVDYIYFDDSSPPVHRIVNMSDAFLLDDGHLALFDAVGKTR